MRKSTAWALSLASLCSACATVPSAPQQVMCPQLPELEETPVPVQSYTSLMQNFLSGSLLPPIDYELRSNPAKPHTKPPAP